MSPDEYRRIALSFPGASEGSHMDHPDFRVDGKIFATLWKDNGVAMLSPDQQRMLVELKPDVFAPLEGGWGKKGSTKIILGGADEKSVRDALLLAWSEKAKKNRAKTKGKAPTGPRA